MIFFDTETTGLTKPEIADLNLQPHITEIYAVRVDNSLSEIIGEVNTLVKPPIAIPDFITRATGIDDDMVKDAPSFIEIYHDLVNLFLGETDMIAHNCDFDKRMLSIELMRHELQYKFPWPKNHTCTVEKSLSLMGHRLKLGELHEIATGKVLEDAHRAKNDVFGMIRCYEWMREQGLVK